MKDGHLRLGKIKDDRKMKVNPTSDIEMQQSFSRLALRFSKAFHLKNPDTDGT